MRQAFWCSGTAIAILAALLTACGTAAPPTPTPIVLFVTPTPGGAGVPVSPPPAVTATLPPATSPPATPSPTAAPTSTPLPAPQAVINSPEGRLNVRSGPGTAYPSLGAYDNGVEVAVLGKQTDADGNLWFFIPFAAGPSGKGWIYAAHTTAQGADRVPWVNPPPLPTATPTPQPTAPPTPYAVVSSPDGFLYVRSGPGVMYQPPIGAFQNDAALPIIGKQYSPGSDELWWLVPFPAAVSGQGWIAARFTRAFHDELAPWVVPPPTPTPTPTPLPTPTALPTATPPQTPAPVVSWNISGWVADARTRAPISGARVETVLGRSGLRLAATTGADGAFVLDGQAADTGTLELTITALGYLPFSMVLPDTSPRHYELGVLELTPLTSGCRYESVEEMSQSAGLSRLQSLGFTAVVTAPVRVAGDTSLVGLILTQSPPPPPPDRLMILDCAATVTLGVGVPAGGP